MANMENVKKVVLKYYDNADCGLFFTRNIVGDFMSTIYEDEEVTIDICRYWAYFEIFGLNLEEQREIATFYEKLKVERRKEKIAEEYENGIC